MATYKSPNYGRTPVGDRAGDSLIARFVWPITTQMPDASGNLTTLVDGDKILIGQLPAQHHLIPEDCCSIASADSVACHFGIAVDADANLIVSNHTNVGSTYERVAAIAGFYAQSEVLGVSTLNRDVYIILNQANTTAGGYLVAQVGYVPVAEKPVS